MSTRDDDKKKNEATVSISTLEGITHSIDYKLSDTVANLKGQLQRETGHPVAKQTLIKEGYRLKNREILGDLDLQRVNGLQLVIARDEPPPPPPPQNDPAYLKLAQELRDIESAPGPRLNLPFTRILLKKEIAYHMGIQRDGKNLDFGMERKRKDEESVMEKKVRRTHDELLSMPFTHGPNYMRSRPFRELTARLELETKTLGIEYLQNESIHLAGVSMHVPLARRLLRQELLRLHRL